jgi:hypothetical protein
MIAVASQVVHDDLFPTILDPTRPDGDVNHPDHWSSVFVSRYGGVDGYAAWLAIEQMVAERRWVRRSRSWTRGAEWPGYRFMDGSGIVMLDTGPFRVSPNGTAHCGHVEWLEEE